MNLVCVVGVIVLVELGLVNEDGYFCKGCVGLVDNCFDIVFGIICVCVIFDNVDG